jgi:hypothetical protein
MKGQLWVELVGDLILARVRGEPTAELLRECHEKVLVLVKDAGKGKILYDTLEMESPPVDVPLAQQETGSRARLDKVAACHCRFEQSTGVSRPPRIW